LGNKAGRLKVKIYFLETRYFWQEMEQNDIFGQRKLNFFPLPEILIYWEGCNQINEVGGIYNLTGSEPLQVLRE